MIFIDSWVWLELFLKGDKSEKAKKIISKLEKEKGVINTFVLLEVSYRIGRKYGQKEAEKIARIIESFENLVILPVELNVIKEALKLRLKYYSKEKQVSYGDVIHLATAILSNCDILYSGDPDFKNIEEIKTKII